MRSLAVKAGFFALLVSLLLGGCGLLPDKVDETTGWSAEKIYTEAKDAMNDGAYDKAIKLFEKLEARYPYGRYAQQAQLEVAYAYFKQLDPASTITACDRFIRLHPNHPNVDYAYYLKGLANFGEDPGFLSEIGMQDLSERDPKAPMDSFYAFKELVRKFPESKYAADATARMNYLTNTLASHEVHVARYYLKRGAYVAAINRAQTSLKNYPGSPANEEALFVIIKSYDGLGMKDLRDDSERVMRKNFPKSKYLTNDLNQTSPWWKLW
ncbi:MAG: outer membrane protein assembly factor BamD [Sterolibacterium sp.]|nr:outer membrane protein assembly factor BamD [Sterolibacterium sp.]